ncbi:MAG: MFS transporter [Candidatus Micrarchaeaceae archaeon]
MTGALAENSGLMQNDINSATSYLIEKYSPGGKRIGWLMIASIFVESWDLYSISFILIFLSVIFHPSALLLGLTAAATQGGAVIGALTGGWLADKIGRRPVFLSTMIIFIVFGLAQAFAPNMSVLAILRFILGYPLGMDVANGFTYIMEVMQKGKREVMGNRWIMMFAVGELAAIAVVAVLLLAHVAPNLIWRVVLGASAIPAAVILALRWNIPETAIWLIQQGKFMEAKKITKKLYNDDLAMLPDRDVNIPKPHLSRFLSEIRKDRTKWRASVFGWLSCFAQSSEFATFGFYLPMFFILLHVSGTLGTDLLTFVIYIVALISSIIGPQITPKIGQRHLSMYGFSIVLIALLIAAAAIFSNHLIILPIVAALMLFGHEWDAENGMTVASMVAPPKYKGTSSGFSYLWVKIPAFLSIFLFPTFFDMVGKGWATLFVAIFPLIGLLAATFILREVYGYNEVEKRSIEA